MVITRNKESPNINVKIGDTKLEQVKRYEYLGQLITEDGKSDGEIIRRIGMARATFNNMKNILLTREIIITTRIRVLKCYIWPVLMYGSETWTICKSTEKRLEAFEMWMYRRMLRILLYFNKNDD